MAELEAFRVAAWDTPLRVNVHRASGRYHRVGSSATQYFCLHPLTPWAEYLRRHDLRDEEAITPVRLRMWALKVSAEGIARIDFQSAGDWGLRAEDLVSDDHRACQDIADELRADPAAPKTIEVPSAALPGTRNLVVFGERVMIPYGATPISEIDVPSVVLAERARPPAEAVDLVRYRGMEHEEFAAWSAGKRYRFGGA
ncbi:MAG: RES family NAD+ phosphorylase [Solirubrobacterales bacterium]